jgi:hypothetical protein
MSSMTGKENRMKIEISTGTIVKVVTVTWVTFSILKSLDKHIAAGLSAGSKELKEVIAEQKDAWADATGEKTA